MCFMRKFKWKRLNLLTDSKKMLLLRLVQLLRLFRALQTSRVLNISTYAQLQHELIVN